MIGHHAGSHHFHLTRSELSRVNWTHSFRNIGMSMVGVLVPVYLLKLGFSLEQVLAYFTLCGAFWLVMIYPAARLIALIGGNHVMALATIISIVHLFVLMTISAYGWPLWLSALLFGIMIAMYWYSLRVNYSAGIDLSKRGSQVGISTALYLAGGGLAPALGGIIASVAGIQATYITAIALVAVAAIPMLKNTESFRFPTPKLSNLKVKKLFRDYFSNACLTIDDMLQATAWPLLISFSLPSYAGVGIISTVVVVSAITISLFVGRREATKGERRYITEGSYSMAAVGGIRLLAQNAPFITGVNFLYGASRALVDTPYTSRYYERIEQESTLEYIMGMQFASAIGWTLMGLMLLLLLQLLPPATALLAGLALIVPLSFGIKLIH